MDAETLAYEALLAVAAVLFGVWAYKNVWKAPRVVKARVVDKSWDAAAMRLPDALPGMGAVARASTTNILVLDIEGKEQRLTANDESWKKAKVGDTLKVWIQNESHVVGVHVLNRRTQNE